MAVLVIHRHSLLAFGHAGDFDAARFQVGLAFRPASLDLRAEILGDHGDVDIMQDLVGY